MFTLCFTTPNRNLKFAFFVLVLCFPFYHVSVHMMNKDSHGIIFRMSPGSGETELMAWRKSGNSESHIFSSIQKMHISWSCRSEGDGDE